MDLPIPSEEILAQPTRARIFELLVADKRPVPTGTIAKRLDLHVNGVRRHLERLAGAGLIERRVERGGRGRPGDRWVVAPGANPGGHKPTAYAELAVWLAEAIPPEPEALERVEEVGFRIGRSLRSASAEQSGESVAEAFSDAFAALGFQPEVSRSEDGGFDCRLGNCPYLESATANREAVCGLHRGMTRGLLERVDDQAELVRFEPHDPGKAGCVVTVR